ncbi:hypothetical protein OLL83_000757 [Shewanella algae]|uniref:hypothetical protein n=1 Tax=Shewanella algae TaxID=38313 RepID=UPI00222EBFD2|nr:hypothetical protein [Shewanella algae]UZD59240.1 hypothetical protein OLL83_000757 [Shewanella algae]
MVFSFVNNQEFWLSLAMIFFCLLAILAVCRFGFAISKRDFNVLFFKVLRRRIFTNGREQDASDLVDAYLGYLRERNNLWDKYGQIILSIIIIMVLAILLLTKTISPEAGLPILSAVGGFSIAKAASVSSQTRSGPTNKHQE